MQDFKNLKVLIIEDAKPMQDLLSDRFKDLGFKHIEVASNGEDGIYLYKTLNPTIVTMDIGMPKVDGFEAIEEILKINKNARIIVISKDGTLEKKSLKIGAMDFLVKPFKFPLFKEKILNLLNKEPSSFIPPHINKNKKMNEDNSPKIVEIIEREENNQTKNAYKENIVKNRKPEDKIPNNDEVLIEKKNEDKDRVTEKTNKSMMIDKVTDIDKIELKKEINSNKIVELNTINKKEKTNQLEKTTDLQDMLKVKNNLKENNQNKKDKIKGLKGEEKSDRSLNYIDSKENTTHIDLKNIDLSEIEDTNALNKNNHPILNINKKHKKTEEDFCINPPIEAMVPIREEKNKIKSYKDDPLVHSIKEEEEIFKNLNVDIEDIGEENTRKGDKELVISIRPPRHLIQNNNTNLGESNTVNRVDSSISTQVNTLSKGKLGNVFKGILKKF